MYMYLLISTVEFTTFCIYNDLDFCCIIHISSIHSPRTAGTIEEYNIFGCSVPHRSYAPFPA